ncbi:MAG: hypothetical protein H0V89_11795, partial [Deltaproteobacteria bacterium]|nr:hypothetical protein [Deltaproteobacteria bacterium]
MSRSARSLGRFTSWLALCACGPAFAGTVTITPLLGVGTNEKQVAGLRQLMASELEFMPEVSGVTEAAAGPPNAACLTSTSCLGGLVQGTDQLLTGAVAITGSNFALDLVLYDKATNKVVRRKTATVPADATQLANSMTGVLREVLTGEGPKDEAATPAPGSFEDGDSEEGGFAPGAVMAPSAADPENLSF